MRTTLLVLCLMVAAGCAQQIRPSAHNDDLARILAAKRVRVGVKVDAPPFGYTSGDTIIGFDIDIAHAVAKQLGIERVELVPVTSANRDDKLLAGEIDMAVASMTTTRYRERKLDFTIPYFQDGEALLVRQGSPIATYLDLEGRTVGCVKGSTSSFYIRQVAPGCSTVVVADFAALLAALDAGTVDAVTSDAFILIGLMRSSSDPTRYRIAGERFTTEPYGIAVRENQSDWRDALNEALMAMWEDGTWRTIAGTWFGPGSKYQSDLTFAITPIPK
jgi:polar amino acid transport system substrate-binding protein